MRFLEKIKEKIKEKYIKRKKELLKLKYKSYYNSDRLYKEYKMLDVLIVYLEEVGIKSYTKSYSMYRSKIIFNDNTELIFWDSDTKMSTMSSGSISFSNGESLIWDNKSPSYEVLYKFSIAIKKINEYDEYDDFSKYLPIKLQRKVKLKNLK